MLQAVRSELIDSPFFEPLPELASLFNYNGSQYVGSAHHPVFAMPFSKMNSEPFWQLILKPGHEQVDVKMIHIKPPNC